MNMGRGEPTATEAVREVSHVLGMPTLRTSCFIETSTVYCPPTREGEANDRQTLTFLLPI
jgi:hypothetical protein